MTGVHVGYFSKAMCKQMLERQEKKGKKSAMIVTGSGLGCIPTAGTAHYSAAKAFARFIADSLCVEWAKNVDVLHYAAGEVNTKMLKRNTTNIRICSAETAASSCLRDLGYERDTNGCLRHEVAVWFLNSLPVSLFQNMTFSIAEKTIKKIRKREA